MINQNPEDRKTKLIREIDAELSKCGLIRRPFPEGTRSLFKAVSDWLYFTQRYADQLVQLCKSQLRRRVESNVALLNTQTLTSKLSIQFENRVLVKDYYENPDLNGFTKTHLSLISLVYDRRIIIYHMAENYLSTLSVNNSSNKHAPIILCKIDNSYAAVMSSEVQGIVDMVRARICEKLMSHSFSISNKNKEERVNKLFETPKRMHKKSLSLCDQLEYQGIFDTPSHFAYHNPIHSSKHIAYQSGHQDQDLTLIGMCNINGFVQYPAEKSGFLGFSPQINRAMSMRIMTSNSATKKDPSDPVTNRHMGRLKFFDENKNYGFIVMDEDNSDIFVHFDDLSKAGMTKEYMRTTKHGNIIRFEFSSMTYVGKYDKSRKAVDLSHVDISEYPF